jgi:hypothetical protein
MFAFWSSGDCGYDGLRIKCVQEQETRSRSSPERDTRLAALNSCGVCNLKGEYLVTVAAERNEHTRMLGGTECAVVGYLDDALMSHTLCASSS